MKTRNLISALKKQVSTDEDVVIVLDNSEENFTVTGVQSVPGKKILTLKVLEEEKAPLDSKENQTDRTKAEPIEFKVKVIPINKENGKEWNIVLDGKQKTIKEDEYAVTVTAIDAPQAEVKAKAKLKGTKVEFNLTVA